MSKATVTKLTAIPAVFVAALAASLSELDPAMPWTVLDNPNAEPGNRFDQCYAYLGRADGVAFCLELQTQNQKYRVTPHWGFRTPNEVRSRLERYSRVPAGVSYDDRDWWGVGFTVNKTAKQVARELMTRWVAVVAEPMLYAFREVAHEEDVAADRQRFTEKMAAIIGAEASKTDNEFETWLVPGETWAGKSSAKKVRGKVSQGHADGRVVKGSYSVNVFVDDLTEEQATGLLQYLATLKQPAPVEPDWKAMVLAADPGAKCEMRGSGGYFVTLSSGMDANKRGTMDENRAWRIASVVVKTGVKEPLG